MLQAKFLDFKIQNMVGSCDVKFPIRLEGLVLQHGQFSRWVYCSYYSLKRFKVLPLTDFCLKLQESVESSFKISTFKTIENS